MMVLPNNWPTRDPSQKLVDFVMDNGSDLFTDLSPGNQGYFEMVRGVGKLIEMKDLDDTPRTESVMGLRTGGKWEDLPFPSTPLPADLISDACLTRRSTATRQPTEDSKSKPAIQQTIDISTGKSRKRLKLFLTSVEMTGSVRVSRS
ncbi:hypothetical protein MFFC18_24820 [Mariniblastus fucicola]|uniref:Uncharacterized protein n=1 Tax=Mariniblastus fucicola TaxID=980251 RepID=A0A5B9PAT2_9BACT|nr:hypothetical protein MFFC18_24820 [Mariniblastus fucicola]